MTLLVHAILPAEAALAPAASGLTRVATARVLALASVPQVARLGRAEMLAHHTLVARVHADSATCLPARFPTLVADAEALRALLVQREVELLAALERVRERAELAITALWMERPEPEPVHAETPGRRYLLERQADQALRTRARTIADELEACIPEALETQRRLCPRVDTAVSLALLVPRAQAPALRTRLAHIDERRDVRILVNGPWPPYSFVAFVVKEG